MPEENGFMQFADMDDLISQIGSSEFDEFLHKLQGVYDIVHAQAQNVMQERTCTVNNAVWLVIAFHVHELYKRTATVVANRGVFFDDEDTETDVTALAATILQVEVVADLHVNL